MEITTTTWLISNIQDITLKKLEAQTLLQKLEQELRESELQQRINKWKELLKELEQEEVEIKNQWIKILQNSWVDKFEANWVEVRLKTSAWKLVVTEQDLIPEEYIKTTTKTTTSVDKTALKKAMKEWEIFDWCKIEQTLTLEIKHK